jgi:hypothetical protein
MVCALGRRKNEINLSRLSENGYPRIFVERGIDDPGLWKVCLVGLDGERPGINSTDDFRPCVAGAPAASAATTE